MTAAKVPIDIAQRWTGMGNGPRCWLRLAPRNRPAGDGGKRSVPPRPSTPGVATAVGKGLFVYALIRSLRHLVLGALAEALARLWGPPGHHRASTRKDRIRPPPSQAHKAKALVEHSAP